MNEDPLEELFSSLTMNVHVVNAEEIRPPEKPASVNHVITRTFNDIGTIIEILQEDPSRVKTEVFISGTGTVFICHSLSQAQAALTGVGGNFGASIPCPGPGTQITHYTDYTNAKQWAVLTGASPVLSLISEKKAA